LASNTKEKQSSLFVYSVLDKVAKFENIDMTGQFCQHFWHQSRAAFAQIIFLLLLATALGKKFAQMWHSVQKLLSTICSKISAERL
jgi:hypothetical protein